MATRLKRRRGYTRLSAKHQVTLPVDIVREAGLETGDEFRVELASPGVLVLRRTDDDLSELEALAGSMPGVWPEGWLDELRDEWD